MWIYRRIYAQQIVLFLEIRYVYFEGSSFSEEITQILFLLKGEQEFRNSRAMSVGDAAIEEESQ